MVKICVFTILFGSFDSLQAPLIDFPPNVDAYLLTDKAQGDPPAPYQKITLHDLPYTNPRQNARHYKLLPPKHLWDACDVSIQHDANVDLLKSPIDLVDRLVPKASLGLVRHPFLGNYEAEIRHLCQIYPHDCSLYKATRDHYALTQSFDPITSTQYETSFMIRRHSPKVREMMEAWSKELFSSGHLRDQVLLAPVLQRYQDSLGIQLYLGHNVDFAKWRCHVKVMGQARSGLAHGTYCALYYGVKRYTPWIERWFVPMSYTLIGTWHLDHPLMRLFVVSTFLLAMAGVILKSKERYTAPGSSKKHVQQSLMYAFGIAVVVGIVVSWFYTIPMGVALLWPCVFITVPIVYSVLPTNKKLLVMMDNKKNDEDVVVMV